MNDTRLTLTEIRGPLNDLLGKLEGRNGRNWLRALKRFLRRETPWPKDDIVFATVDIGTFLDLDHILRVLHAVGVQIDDFALQMIKKVKVAGFKQSLDLVKLSAEDLGFPDGTFLHNAYNSAMRLGLQLCPAEACPQLAYQHTNDLRGVARFVFAMESIETIDGSPRVFTFEGSTRGLVLETKLGVKSTFLAGADHIVFVRPQTNY